MSDDKAVTVHRWLQIYVSIVTTALTISVAIIGWTVKDWHNQSMQSQADIHGIKMDLIKKGSIDEMQDYRIANLEKSPLLSEAD